MRPACLIREMIWEPSGKEKIPAWRNTSKTHYACYTTEEGTGGVYGQGQIKPNDYVFEDFAGVPPQIRLACAVMLHENEKLTEYERVDAICGTAVESARNFIREMELCDS